MCGRCEERLFQEEYLKNSFRMAKYFHIIKKMLTISFAKDLGLLIRMTQPESLSWSLGNSESEEVDSREWMPCEMLTEMAVFHGILIFDRCIQSSHYITV